MKKILIVGLLGLLCVSAQAAMDASLLDYDVIVTPDVVAAGATSTNAVVDKNNLGDGVANVVVSVGIATNATSTATVLIQAAAASTGTYATVETVTVTGLTNAPAVGAVAYDLTGGSRYLRALCIVSNGDLDVSGVINSYK